MTYSLSSASGSSSASAVTATSRSPSRASQINRQHDSTSEETTPLEKKDSPGRAKLRSWLHSLMSVVLSDGRTLVGTFMCTDRDTNIILSSCTEHLPHSHTDGEEEARMLGLAMVPGRHVISLSVDERTVNQRHHQLQQQGQQQEQQLQGQQLQQQLQVQGQQLQQQLQQQQQQEEQSAGQAPYIAIGTQVGVAAGGGGMAQALEPPAGYT